MSLIRAEAISKHFGAFCALDNVSLSIGDGEHVSIIGPNGAGKSTLVNLLTGLLRPTAGTVMFKGRSVSGESAVALARQGMARSFQLVSIFPELTVGETLAVSAVSRLRLGRRLLASLTGNRQVLENVREVGELFGLAGKLDQRSRSLSQGDKKLLDVASAFALKPEVILLDEPTSGVSTADKTQIMHVLVRAAERTGIKAIIQVEHDMDIVFGYSNRIVAVHNGRILADCTPDELRKNAEVMATVVGRQDAHAQH